MRLVVGTLLVKQLSLGFPVEPAVVEWPVAVTDETSIHGASALKKCVTNRAGVEPCFRIHHRWISASYLLMTQVSAEVVGNSHLQPVEVNVYQERVPAGLDPWKRGREQVRQRRPIMPAVAHCHRREGQA